MKKVLILIITVFVMNRAYSQEEKTYEPVPEFTISNRCLHSDTVICIIDLGEYIQSLTEWSKYYEKVTGNDPDLLPEFQEASEEVGTIYRDYFYHSDRNSIHIEDNSPPELE